jgi:hypothetical protein
MPLWRTPLGTLPTILLLIISPYIIKVLLIAIMGSLAFPLGIAITFYIFWKLA